MSKEEYNYKRKSIKAAKELHYPQSVISQLQSATTETQIERIMIDTRRRYL